MVTALSLQYTAVLVFRFLLQLLQFATGAVTAVTAVILYSQKAFTAVTAVTAVILHSQNAFTAVTSCRKCIYYSNCSNTYRVTIYCDVVNSWDTVHYMLSYLEMKQCPN